MVFNYNFYDESGVRRTDLEGGQVQADSLEQVHFVIQQRLEGLRSGETKWIGSEKQPASVRVCAGGEIVWEYDLSVARNLPSTGM